MQVHRTYKLIVTWDIMVKHLSGGVMDATWVEAGQKFLTKYKQELPSSCISEVPDLQVHLEAMHYDLRGKAPQVTIV
jgi:hypothetical protein